MSVGSGSEFLFFAVVDEALEDASLGLVEFFAEGDGVDAAAGADPDEAGVGAVEPESVVFSPMVSTTDDAQIGFDGGAVVLPGGDVVDVAVVGGAEAAGCLAVFVPGPDVGFLLGGGPVV